MILLLLVLIGVATVFGAEQTDAPSKGVLLLNFKDPPAINIFDTPTSFPNFKVIENIIFLNEAEECRSKYPNIDQTTFYQHLYCSLKNEDYTTSTGISCVMTKPLIKKIQKRLNDFIVFRNLSKMKEFCWENNFRQKRNSLDSDLLPGVEFMGENPKEMDKNYVYLGPSMFPLTTELYNRLLRLRERGNDTKKRAEDQEVVAGKQAPKDDKQTPTADSKEKVEGKKETEKKTKHSSKPRSIHSSKHNWKPSSKHNSKYSSKYKPKYSSKHKPKYSSKHKPKYISKQKPANKKKAPPKSVFQLFKFRMFKKKGNKGDQKILEYPDELNDPFCRVKGKSFLYFKLFETLLNIFGHFNQHMEKEKNKELMENGKKEEIKTVMEETTVGDTVEKTAEKTAEKTTEKTAEETGEDTVEKTAKETAEETVENTVEKTVENTVDETAEETVENTVDETAEETVENTVEKTVEKTAEETLEKTVEDTVEDTVEKTVNETVEEATEMVTYEEVEVKEEEEKEEVVSSTENNHKTEAPAVYYTLS